MQLGGSIRISGPDFEKGETLVEEDGIEFFLETEKGKESSIRNFSIYVKMDEDAAVELRTDMEEAESVEDFITIGIDGKNSLELVLSFKQAAGIKDLLQHYVDAYHAVQALRQTCKVDRI